MHNRIPAVFSSPLGVLKGEGGRGDVNLGLGTKGKGESPAGGSGKDKRLPESKGSRLLSWGSWGLFPVSSSPAPLIPSLQYNSTNHGSHVSCQPVWPYGHCRLGRVVWREGPCHVESGDYERSSSRVREDERILSPQNPPPPSTPVSCLLLPGDCHQPV